MKRGNTASSVFIAAALAGAPSFAGAALSPQTIERLEAPCADVTTRAQAASCVAPFAVYAGVIAEDIWAALHEKGALDTSKMKRSQAREYRELAYETLCVGWTGRGPSETETPESYLAAPQQCLTMTTDLADRFGVAYDKEAAEYLIARMRRLRHLDIR